MHRLDPSTSFEEEMEDRDGRENHRREHSKANIAKLPEVEKERAQQEEQRTIDKYE